MIHLNHPADLDAYLHPRLLPQCYQNAEDAVARYLAH